MKIITSKKEITYYISSLKKSNTKISFIPTMGNLHDGHLSLIKSSEDYDAIKIVSLFVNPLQFNNKEDFENYPSTIEKDIKTLQKHNIDCLFMPNKNEILSKDFESIKLPSGFNNLLCGKYRERHFEGVYIIVKKLLDIITPNYIFFGEKDYQQLLLIKYIYQNFYKNINNFSIIACPIIRDITGLALSSRNNLLNNTQRTLASKTISDIKKNLINSKEPLNSNNFQDLILSVENNEISIEYIESWDLSNLHLQHGLANIEKDLNNKKRIFLAIYVGKVRLIDNFEIQ
tara:strand:+ start:144 stop:1007 length:864 start_codon:yes stop_codon:yes gene_type:complete